jgi:transposase
MFLDLHTYNWFIRPGQTDMRKRSNSLSMLVHNEMNLNLFEKNIFVFCGSNKKVIRAIVWEKNGWWEISKRIEHQTLSWPENNEEAMQVSIESIKAVLQGADPWRSFSDITPLNE